MSKRVAILQSNYIPWKGYFDMIAAVDEFILYDDAQFTRQDWRNRNLVKTPNGTIWLTIPVEQRGRLEKKISDIKVRYDSRWPQKHWRTLSQSYAKAPFYPEYKAVFEDFYNTVSEEYLSTINLILINLVNSLLGISTPIRDSREYEISGNRNERLIHLCKQAEADIYLSGPAAKQYLDEALFRKEDILVEYMDYSGYPEYQQLYQPFEHNVTVLDLLFNMGPHAQVYMKYM